MQLKFWDLTDLFLAIHIPHKHFPLDSLSIHTAKANTFRRVLDLLVGVGAPIGTGALLGVMSNTVRDTAGVLFICALNSGTKFAEYLVLLYVYRKDGTLAFKDGGGGGGGHSDTQLQEVC